VPWSGSIVVHCFDIFALALPDSGQITALFPLKCPWHQTCFWIWLRARAVGARSGTDGEHARLNSVRPIGGAEEMKWKKPNEFNSSEWRIRANSLDLVENGPLY
jgi:hypothetical protein